MKKITTLVKYGRTFIIVKDNHGYWGIEDIYITDEKLNKEINGITGHLKDTLNECIKSVLFTVTVEHFKSLGYSLEQAFAMAICEEV